jgi:hypothetical protein
MSKPSAPDTKPSDPDDEIDVLRGAEEIAAAIRVSPRRVYALAGDPAFPIRREGRLLVASRQALRTYYGA